MKRMGPTDVQRAVRDKNEYRTGSNTRIEANQGLERALGAKIMDARRELDLSVFALSSAAKISAGMLSKIENGQISQSPPTLQSIATALAILLSPLFTASEERCDRSVVRENVAAQRWGTSISCSDM